MIDMLVDPAVTGVVVVATPEEMPVNETLELVERLDAETGIDIAAVIANRVLPELFGRAEEATFEQIDTPEGRAKLTAAAGDGADAAIDAAGLAVRLRRSRAVHLATLRDRLPTRVPLIFLPYLFTKTHGMRTIHRVAEHLAEELL
jgi:anion-transporting  ArsA/GET3 family ATPase